MDEWVDKHQVEIKDVVDFALDGASYVADEYDFTNENQEVELEEGPGEMPTMVFDDHIESKYPHMERRLMEVNRFHEEHSRKGDHFELSSFEIRQAVYKDVRRFMRNKNLVSKEDGMVLDRSNMSQGARATVALRSMDENLVVLEFMDMDPGLGLDERYLVSFVYSSGGMNEYENGEEISIQTTDTGFVQYMERMQQLLNRSLEHMSSEDLEALKCGEPTASLYLDASLATSLKEFELTLSKDKLSHTIDERFHAAVELNYICVHQQH